MDTNKLGTDFMRFLKEYDELWKLVQNLQDRHDAMKNQVASLLAEVNALRTMVTSLELRIKQQQVPQTPYPPYTPQAPWSPIAPSVWGTIVWGTGQYGGSSTIVPPKTQLEPQQVKAVNPESVFNGLVDEGAACSFKYAPYEFAQNDDEIRAGIVEEAKEAITKLTNSAHFVMNVVNPVFARMSYHPSEFYVLFRDNPDKRRVDVLIYWKHNRELVAKGTARCHHEDTFNLYIGRAIALYRAFRLPVPKHFVDAPNPTQVEVGHKVRVNRGTFEGVVGEVEAIIPSVVTNIKEVAQIKAPNHFPSRFRSPFHLLDIIDDTALF